MQIGNRIYELRKKHNLSQEQLAEMVGVARQTISKWELSETSPDIKQAQMLSQIFNVSLDEMLCNDTKQAVNDVSNCKKNSNIPWRKIIAAISALIFVCLIIIGVFGMVKRWQILYPEGTNRNIVINIKDPILIEKGMTDTIVFKEKNKPTIACELPKGFVSDTDTVGLFTYGDGNFLKFNADYLNNVENPLVGTEYYAYYEDEGYHSYMDMARAAMYKDLPRLGIFSSMKKLHLAGGAQLIRQQLCAGQGADYYPIDGELTESGDKMHLYGFALYFEKITCMIMLKDCKDIYYFITLKDPNGIGKTIDTVGEFLSKITVEE